jgi:hypothetical protein
MKLRLAIVRYLITEITIINRKPICLSGQQEINLIGYIKNNTMRKTYKKIKLQLDTGKIFVEDVTESNFHPSQVNEIINEINDKHDYSFTIAESKSVKKQTISLIKYHLRKVEKELSYFRRHQECYQKALDRVSTTDLINENE